MSAGHERALVGDQRDAALTCAGAALLEEARELLNRADRAVAIARATGSGERGRLRMSLTRSLTGGVAGAIVDAYRARYPEVELSLSLGTTMLHVEQLRTGEIDVGFVRPPLEEPGLWRRDDNLPTLRRLRELAAEVARGTTH